MVNFLCLSVILCFPVLLNCSTDCTYHNVSYSVCDLMFWTRWTVCNGITCPNGQRQRFKSICCERKSPNETTQVIKQRCMNACNMTENDFKDHSPSLPSKGRHISAPNAIIWIHSSVTWHFQIVMTYIQKVWIMPITL